MYDFKKYTDKNKKGSKPFVSVTDFGFYLSVGFVDKYNTPYNSFDVYLDKESKAIKLHASETGYKVIPTGLRGKLLSIRSKMPKGRYEETEPSIFVLSKK